MKGVIYARYSSDSQREESIEGQIRDCMEFAEKNGITILNSYIDRAFSAKTDNRPSFQQMIKDSGKKLFDVIIVWKLDRFARNCYDSAQYKMILRKNGVKVTSATETIAEDSSGILLESVLEGYAEFFSAELAEKVVRGQNENAYKCKYNGGGIPLGYIIDDEQYFQLDPNTAPVVLEVFKQYADGATIVELVNDLNARGVRGYRNGKVSIDSIKRILSNRKYLGFYIYRDIEVPDGIPRIVSQDLFDKVQIRLAKNKKAPARYKAEDRYLLTTKLFCGHCGVFMVGESGTSHTMKVHRYYKCANTKKKKLCDKKNVKKDWIENIAIKYTMEMLNDDELIAKLIDMAVELHKKESTMLPMLKQQLDEANRGIQNMLNAIQQGILTSSTKQRLDELEETKSKLEVSILQEQLQRPPITREQMAFWISRLRKLDISDEEQRQRLINIFVNGIYLYDDKIVFIFNYKDGAKL